MTQSLYVKLSKNSKDYGEPDITYQLAGADKREIGNFHFIEKNSPKVAQFDNFYYLCTHETQDKDIRRLF